MASSRTWHIRIGNETLSPVSESLVALMLKQNRLQFTDYAWSEGLAQWTRLGELAEFARYAPSYPPVPVPSAGSKVVTAQAPPTPPVTTETVDEHEVVKRHSTIRQKERVETRGTVSLEHGGTHRIVNLSETGVLISCGKTRLALGDEVSFALEFEGVKKPLRMTGILLREEGSTDDTCVAIEFTRVNPAHRRELKSFIESKSVNRKSAA